MSTGRPPRPRKLPRSGAVLVLDGQASVQFAGERALTVRVIRVHDWYTYVGWCWLEVYVLDRAGAAVERRSLFVQVAGLRLAPVGSARPMVRFGPIPAPRVGREAVADAVRQ